MSLDKHYPHTLTLPTELSWLRFEYVTGDVYLEGLSPVFSVSPTSNLPVLGYVLSKMSSSGWNQKLGLPAAHVDVFV